MNDDEGTQGGKMPTNVKPIPEGMHTVTPSLVLAGGAKARRRPEDMFWGDRTGAVSDPFGYEWEFATRVKNLTPEEMRRAGQEFARKMAAGQ
jgi:uncharacterized glyoxalase superfamily protein PhnB